MKIALLHNHYDAAKLESIVEEMKVMGAPTIKVLDLDFDGMVQALEGCHRLRACEILNVTPTFEWVDATEMVETDDGVYQADELGDYENYFIAINNNTDKIETDEDEKEFC